MNVPTEVLAGLVDRVTFHNADNGFCVLRVKARGQRDLITIIGHAATISAGEFVQANGNWINDRTHGVQFRASFLKATAPTTIEGIEKYLGSGMIRGIGPVYAKKLVRAFGEAVFEVVAQEPDRLREVSGIGPKRAERIIAGWAEQQVTRDIRGIGFRTAAQIAAKLGIDKTALIRVRAGISFALGEAMDDGHCGLPLAELTPLAEKLLDVPQALVRTALDLELADGTVVADRLADTDCVFLSGLHRAERAIADRLLALNKGQLPWPVIDPDKAIPWIERRIGFTLAGN